MNAFMKWAASLLLVISLQVGLTGAGIHSDSAARAASRYDQVLYFPLSKYPETGNHIKDAISAGHSEICTIDRGGAENRRKESLKGIPTKPGLTVMNGPWQSAQKAGRGLISDM